LTLGLLLAPQLFRVHAGLLPLLLMALGQPV
jgi:hypothetical protein